MQLMNITSMMEISLKRKSYIYTFVTCTTIELKIPVTSLTLPESSVSISDHTFSIVRLLVCKYLTFFNSSSEPLSLEF